MMTHKDMVAALMHISENVGQTTLGETRNDLAAVIAALEVEPLAEGWALEMALDKYRAGYQHYFRVNRHRPRIGHRRVAIYEGA
jgi:hypothetical protein